jgi:hypothetical protein
MFLDRAVNSSSRTDVDRLGTGMQTSSRSPEKLSQSASKWHASSKSRASEQDKCTDDEPLGHAAFHLTASQEEQAGDPYLAIAVLGSAARMASRLKVEQ